MNFLLFLFTVFLLSVSSIASSDNSSAQSSAIGQGGNAYGGTGGVGFGGDGGAGGSGGAGGLGGTAYGGIGGAGGIGTGTGGNASNAGNSQSLHFDQVRQSPAVFMGAPMPTAVCQATAGGFLSFIGGAGFAASFTLAQCEIREEARSLAALGRPDLGLKIMCASAKYTSQLDECRQQKEMDE